MSGLTLLVLRLAFLLVMWIFIFVIVYTLRSDLFGQRTRKLKEKNAPPSPFLSESTAPVTAGAMTAGAAAVTAATARPPALAGSAPGAGPRRPPLASERTAHRLVITAGPRAGQEIDLPGEQLAIGRSSESGLVIRDDYTSTHHARLMLWNDEWVVQDLDSTNGTFVDGHRVTLPTPVPLDTPVTIGQTTFELRR